MNSIIRYFAGNHLLANLLTLSTILLGLYSFSSIKRDIMPNVNYGITVVTTRYPGASPEDVELNVTNKIEDELKSVTGIDRVMSVSMENISVITIILDPDASDKDEVVDEIREAVGRVNDFPGEVDESPIISEIETGSFPIIEVGLAGDIPYGELREVAKHFEKRLESLPGVSKVTKFGYLAREIEVEINPEKNKNYQISLQEIITAIKQRNIRATGGSFESYTSEKSLVTLAQFEDPMDVGDVIVRSSFDGPLIKVKDLAIIRDDYEDERIRSRINGIPAISFLVTKKTNADAIRTVERIKRLAQGESGLLPEGTQILFSNDFSKLVSNRFDVVQTNGMIGLILVIIVLSLFLSLRSAFWVAMGIPVTLFGVIFMMPIFDIYLDSISMAAMIIVIGIIVDDGIIIAERIQRFKEIGIPPLDAAVKGVSEVFAPVLTTILTTFLAFAPMFFMTGIMGSFVFVIPLVISLALFISLFEATIALPAHLTAGRIKGTKPKNKPRISWFHKIEKPFASLLSVALKLRYLIVLFSIALLAGSFWYAATFMKFELFPTSMAQKMFIMMELPVGASLEATSDRVKKVEKMVMELPEEELESFITRIGTQEPYPAAGFPPGENENWAFMTLSLTPFTERTRTVDDIIEGLRGKTDQLEGFEKINYAVDAGGPPVGKPITLRVVGSNDDLRVKLVDSIEKYMQSMDEVKDIVRNDRLGKEQVNIDIDYNKLSRLGLTVADIARNVRIAYDGEVVTSVRYGDEDVNFRVLLQVEARERTASLNDLLIPNKQGRLIPLSQVANLVIEPGPSNFYHFDEERTITITADIVKDRTTSKLATDQIVDNFNIPRDWKGLRIVVGGEAQETEKSMVSLFYAFGLAIIGIFFLLVLLFNSTTQPFMVISAIPFGITGVIIAFALHSEPIGFVAMLGLIGLMGVVVNDSLVLVVHINRLKKLRPEEKIRVLVVEGTTDRLRAVILTTLTTVVGLLPLVYGVGGSDPYMAPMAMALGYGLLFATPITLALVPSLYLIGNDIGRLFSRSK